MNFVIHWNELSLSLHVFPIPIPHPTSLSTRSLHVFPEHQVRALVSCIQPGLVICFTLDTIQQALPSMVKNWKHFIFFFSSYAFCAVALNCMEIWSSDILFLPTGTEIIIYLSLSPTLRSYSLFLWFSLSNPKSGDFYKY